MIFQLFSGFLSTHSTQAIFKRVLKPIHHYRLVISIERHIMLAVDTFTLLTTVWNITKTLSHRFSKCFKIKIFFVLSHETTTLPST
jgi:hypothetical protein